MTLDIATRQNSAATFLESRKSEIASICNKHMSVERVVQLATLCTYKTPKLLECDPATLLSSVCQVAAMGLDLSPSAGEAYLIPRYNKLTQSLECTVQIGYQGLAKCARSSGAVRLVQARTVRKGDVFKVRYENGAAQITHEPKMDGTPSEITHVYATAKLTTGEQQCEVMTADEVEHIRSKSEKPDSGPWVDFWGEMAKKTVIRRLCKSLPKSQELVQAIALHDAEYDLGEEQLDSTLLKSIPQNNSGFGRGQYASDADANRYRAKLEAFREQQTQQFLDYWSLRCKGELPDTIPSAEPLCRIWQLDGHLVKWAIDQGRLDAKSLPEDRNIQQRQIGRYTAILYFKDDESRGALTREARRYVNELAYNLNQKILREHPELRTDGDLEEATDADFDAISEGDGQCA